MGEPFMHEHPLQIDFPDWLSSDVGDAAFVERLADFLLQTGLAQGASSIMLEPTRKGGICYLRIDGRKWYLLALPIPVYKPLLAHYSIAAEIPDEHPAHFYGATITGRHKGRDVRVGVAALPIETGLKMVLSTRETAPFRTGKELGLGAEEQDELRRIVDLPQGLLIIAGPFGTGCTTTAATLIHQMIDPAKRRIVTLETNREYTFAGALQTYHKHQGLVMPEVVQSLLAHRPDVLFLETLNVKQGLQAAIDAALAGVLTIATLSIFHPTDSVAIDAIDVVSRFVKLRIDPTRVAQAISGVCAQRLVRRICPSCTVEDIRPASDLHRFGYPADDSAQKVTLRRGAGCVECRGSGTRGWIGIFEVLTFNDTLAEMLASGATEEVLRRVSYATGRVGMREDALRKILAGVVTIEDAERALMMVPCIPRKS